MKMEGWKDVGHMEVEVAFSIVHGDMVTHRPIICVLFILPFAKGFIGVTLQRQLGHWQLTDRIVAFVALSMNASLVMANGFLPIGTQSALQSQ